jgi:hypothetical protein
MFDECRCMRRYGDAMKMQRCSAVQRAIANACQSNMHPESCHPRPSTWKRPKCFSLTDRCTAWVKTNSVVQFLKCPKTTRICWICRHAEIPFIPGTPILLGTIIWRQSTAGTVTILKLSIQTSLSQRFLWTAWLIHASYVETNVPSIVSYRLNNQGQ